MQRDTVVTIMDNPTKTIRYHLWAFREAERKLVFWIDLPENDEERARHVATIERHIKRVNNHILPAADDLMDSTKDTFTGDDTYDQAFNLLIHVRNKWVRTTEGVISAEDATGKAQRS